MATVYETATIYKDRNNSFTITLEAAEVILTELEMSVLTKFEIKYQGSYYDSETYPEAFERSNVDGTITVWPVTLGLDVSSRRGDLVEFLIYDAGKYISGLVWKQFRLVVKSDAEVIP